MSVQEDLESRRTQYQKTIDDVNGKIAEIEALPITSETEEFYNKHISNDKAVVSILQQKYDDVNKLVPCQMHLISLTEGLTIKPDTFKVAKTITELPKIEFQAFYANGAEETEITFVSTVCGVSVIFEHDGSKYVMRPETGTFTAPYYDVEYIYLKNSNDRDDSEDDEGKTYLSASALQVKIGDNTSLTLENYHLEENTANVNFKQLETVTFVECTFDDVSSLFLRYDSKTRGERCKIKTYQFYGCKFPQTVLSFNSNKSSTSSTTTSITIVSSGYNPTAIDLATCSALETLEVASCGITNIDLSDCKSLSTLDISGNKFTSFTIPSSVTDVDANSNEDMTSIKYSGSNLTSLNVSNCTKLTSINSNSNKLETLNIEKTNIKELVIPFANITTIDLSSYTTITSLNVHSSKLKSLDASKLSALSSISVYGCEKLEKLNIANTKVTSLNIENCTSLSSLDITNTNITSWYEDHNATNLKITYTEKTYTSESMASGGTFVGYTFGDNALQRVTKKNTLTFICCTFGSCFRSFGYYSESTSADLEGLYFYHCKFNQNGKENNNGLEDFMHASNVKYVKFVGCDATSVTNVEWAFYITPRLIHFDIGGLKFGSTISMGDKVFDYLGGKTKGHEYTIVIPKSIICADGKGKDLGNTTPAVGAKQIYYCLGSSKKYISDINSTVKSVTSYGTNFIISVVRN